MDMNNNDRLIRIRYALDLKDREMMEIFKLGDVDITEAELERVLTKVNEEEDEDAADKIASNVLFESFLNGLITYKRGKQEPKPGQPERPAITIKHNRSINNVLLKKVKIALALTNEDMIAILEDAGVALSKGELSALLRKEGHKNYKPCGDKFARNFLKGLALRYRG